ncbi:CGNR zinc finger domain-containing protein [Paenibacillus senegalensis]|uniref:CGNR zinc finger domain-containing protein n=1 Tax=Paenibacillus senegalensis TaxID=1465766 RepID=UPI000287C103|nr:CGNR zinc finger domain-containing protein [Paenibacillus senegalensis]
MPKKIAPRFYFIGNHPVLDYVNTKIIDQGQPLDLIGTFDDLLDWLIKAGLLSESLGVRCKQAWGGTEQENEIMTAASALREELFKLVRAGHSDGEFAGEKDSIRFINLFLKEQSLSTKLVLDENGFRRVSHTVLRKPLDLLTPVANAAVDFLTTHDLNLVKECENPACVLHFYDNSKNSTRRWCSPKTCGNRMKVAAYLARQKQRSAEES